MTRRQALLATLLAPFGFKAAAEALSKAEAASPAFNAPEYTGAWSFVEPVRYVVPNPAYAEAAYEFLFIGNMEGMRFLKACSPFEEPPLEKKPIAYPLRWNEWDAEGKPISIPPFILEERV